MRNKITLLLVLVLAIFMRFYRFADLFHWTMDEEFWSYLPFNIARGYHFPLIGGHIAGTGLYSGPLFVYLMAIPAKIFSGDPLGFGFTVSIIGVLASGLIYITAKRMFNSQTGLIAAGLYSGSFLMSIFDRHYWNASLTPILSIMALYFVYRIIKSKEFVFSLPLALVLALAFHAHGTGMALLLFTIVTWLVFRLPVKNKMIGLAIILFLVLQLPLLYFDLRHNFLNFRAAESYLTSNRGGSVPILVRAENVVTGFYSAGTRLVYLPAKDLTIEQTLGLPLSEFSKREKAPLAAQIVFVAILVLSVLERKKSLGIKLCLLLIGVTLVGLLMYKEKVPEYFFDPTFVPLFALLAWQLSKLILLKTGRILVLSFLVIFISFNVWELITVKRTSTYSPKLTAVKRAIVLAGGEPFVFNAKCIDYCQIYGFRYLFTYLGKEPVESYMDPYFSWLYEDRIIKEKPKKEITFYVNGGDITLAAKDLED